MLCPIGFKTNIFVSPLNPFDGLVLDYVWVLTPCDSPRTTQDMVYTSKGRSPNINVMVYPNFGGPSEVKVEPSTFVFILK